MRPDEVKHYLDQRPFHPFRIHLTSGQFFDIRKPELVTVTRSALTATVCGCRLGSHRLVRGPGADAMSGASEARETTEFRHGTHISSSGRDAD